MCFLSPLKCAFLGPTLRESCFQFWNASRVLATVLPWAVRGTASILYLICNMILLAKIYRKNFWNGIRCLMTDNQGITHTEKDIGLPWWLSGKSSIYQGRIHGFNPWVRKIPWRRKWQPTLVFLPGKYHEEGSLEATVHEGAKESD